MISIFTFRCADPETYDYYYFADEGTQNISSRLPIQQKIKLSSPYLKYIICLLVDRSRRMNADTIYKWQICSISSLLKVLLLTTEHDNSDFNVVTPKKSFYKS